MPGGCHLTRVQIRCRFRHCLGAVSSADYNEIISRASSPLAFATKKQLFFLLRYSTLILDGGKLSFSLTKSGEKCYLMSSRALQIAAIDNPQNWEWISLPESRFADVAKLRSISWLEIHGIMPARMLSPNTRYVAWLKCMFTEVDDGLDVPSKASIKFVKEDGTVTDKENNIIYLVKPHNRSYDEAYDGWYGIKLGEFFIGEGDSFDVHIKVSETQRLNQKKGLVIEGIELWPNNCGNFEEVSSGDDEASSEEVSSGEDEASSEEVLSLEEDEYSSEEISSNSEKVSSVEDISSNSEKVLSSEEDEYSSEEISSNSEKVSSAEDDASFDEESSGEDDADFEEESSKEDEANEEVSSGEDESNVEEISPGEDEASFEEVFFGEDEANIEEASLREDEASFEDASSGKGEADMQEVSWWEDEANFEEPSWEEDEEFF